MKFVHLDFNKPFEFAENEFDFVSCCFAIYYAENVPFTIGEMHRTPYNQAGRSPFYNRSHA